jgi:uncharacterized membrane protein YdbT with pleckstrin-like domain
MRYIDSTLLPGEKIIFHSRPHWIVYGPVFFAIFLVIIFWDQRAKLEAMNFLITGVPLFDWIYIGFALAIVYLGVASWIRYVSSEYGITNKRVIMKVGLIQRDAFDTFLTRVEGIKVLQSIPGRLLNYGTILVIGTGGTKDAFYAVPDPLEFRRIIQEQMDQEMQEVLKNKNSQ